MHAWHWRRACKAACNSGHRTFLNTATPSYPSTKACCSMPSKVGFPLTGASQNGGRRRVHNTWRSCSPPLELMRQYLRFHDCGKPLCRTVDETGRQHFPNHAMVSAERWSALGGDPRVTWLMANDMQLHSGSTNDCEALRGHPLLSGLIFAGLAEVHANADMFGGTESDSFKAKAKHLERRTAQLLGD